MRSTLLLLIMCIAYLHSDAQIDYDEERGIGVKFKGRPKQVTERLYISETNIDSLPYQKKKPFGLETYRLDKSGRLTRTTSDCGRYGTDVCIYSYRGDTTIRTLYNNKRYQRRLIAVQRKDSQGRISQMRYYVADDRGTLPLATLVDKYDAQGYLVAQVHEAQPGQEQIEVRYVNDASGNHLRIRSANSKENGIYYTYDEYDNPLTENNSPVDGAMNIGNWRYRYLYDKEGNWIRKAKFHESGEIEEVTTRTIIYWP